MTHALIKVLLRYASRHYLFPNFRYVNRPKIYFVLIHGTHNVSGVVADDF